MHLECGSRQQGLVEGAAEAGEGALLREDTFSRTCKYCEEVSRGHAGAPEASEARCAEDKRTERKDKSSSPFDCNGAKSNHMRTRSWQRL